MARATMDLDESKHRESGHVASALGWASYDLANSFFQMTVLVTYFPLWVVQDLGGSESQYALATSLSMALVVLGAPVLGALSDQVGRRMPFLVVSTVLCAALTAALGVPSVGVGLLLFVLANFFFQAGTISYDSLLPVVSQANTRGRVGGIGLAFGSLGSLLALVVGLAITGSMGPGAKPAIFGVTALLFLLASLPCFVWVREHSVKSQTRTSRAARAALVHVLHTRRLLGASPGLARLLVGRFLYTDAANTFLAFMAIYLVADMRFRATQVPLLVMSGTAGALCGALMWGRMVDSAGPRRALHAVLGLWCLVLLVSVVVPLFGLPRELFWITVPVGGVAYSGLSAADRPYLIQLAPPAQLGQAYGLYSMVGRFGSIAGPLVWAAVVGPLDLGRPAAVTLLAAMVAFSYAVLRRIVEPQRCEPTGLRDNKGVQRKVQGLLHEERRGASASPRAIHHPRSDTSGERFPCRHPPPNQGERPVRAMKVSGELGE